MRRKLLIPVVLLGAVYAAVNAGFSIGPVSEVKKGIRDLKEEKEKELRPEGWTVLKSPLKGVYDIRAKLSADEPYDVTDDVYFKGSETKIEAGVILYIDSGFSVVFDGGSSKSELYIEGTSGKPVTFTSKKSDSSVEGNASPFKTAGRI